MTVRAEAIDPSPAPKISLRSLMRRTQLKGALVIVWITSVCLIGAGMWTVGRYANMHLNLLARTLAYNVTAAVVFNDPVEVQHIIDSIAEPEGLSQARVVDASGQVLGAFRDERTSTMWANRLSSIVIDQPVVVPVMQDGKPIGSVSVQVQAHTLIGFLLVGVLLIVLAAILSAVISAFVSRRVQAKVSAPLKVLSTAMRDIARDRSFHQRIPATQIVELDALGRDINSLIAEVERWHSSVEGEKAVLAYHAKHDALTGAANRRQLEPLFLQAMQESQRTGVGFALLAIDCDEFKQINDQYGHPVGDQVLKGLVSQIQQVIRQTDSIVRTGGDEFMILVRAIQSRDDAQLIAKKVMEFVNERSIFGQNKDIRLSISVGEALYPDDARDLEGLMVAADAAMFNSKRSSARNGPV